MRNLCKFLVPVIVPIVTLALFVLFYFGVVEKIEMHPVISLLLESLGYLVLDCLLIMTYYKLYPKLFGVKTPFRFKVPDGSVVIGLILCVPGIWFLLDEIVMVVGEMLGTPIVQESVEGYTLMFIILYSIHAIMLAPVFEELTFRVLTISPFKGRVGKIYAVVMGAIVFGIIHGSADSWETKVRMFLSGILLAALLLYTKNIFYSIFVHALSNTVASVLAIIFTINPNVSAKYMYMTTMSRVRINRSILCFLLFCSALGIAIIIRGARAKKKVSKYGKME